MSPVLRLNRLGVWEKEKKEPERPRLWERRRKRRGFCLSSLSGAAQGVLPKARKREEGGREQSRSPKKKKKGGFSFFITTITDGIGKHVTRKKKGRSPGLRGKGSLRHTSRIRCFTCAT